MTILKRSFGLGVHQRVQHGTNPSIPPEPPVTPEFDTLDFDDADFETGETT